MCAIQCTFCLRDQHATLTLPSELRNGAKRKKAPSVANKNGNPGNLIQNQLGPKPPRVPRLKKRYLLTQLTIRLLKKPVDWDVVEVMVGKDMLEALKKMFKGKHHPKMGDVVAARTILASLKSDFAQSQLWDRVEGKPHQSVEVEVSRTLVIEHPEGAQKAALPAVDAKWNPGAVLEVTFAKEGTPSVDPIEENAS